MNKIFTILLFCLIGLNQSQSAVKVNIFLANPHLESGIWTIDVRAQVLAGQTWRVGSSNIRVDFTTTPTGAATVHVDNPVSGALSCLNTGGYSAMTTTQISGPAISLNITRLAACCTLSTGTYTLGRIRFNRIDTSGCIRLTIRINSVVQDSITQWLNPADWTSTVDTTCYRLDWLTGIAGNENEIPTVFKLYNNYPNPFNPATKIKYDVPKATNMTITVYDILGKEIQKLVNGYVQPGRYEVEWDAANFASGTYFYKFESDYFSDVKKMSLIK